MTRFGTGKWLFAGLMVTAICATPALAGDNNDVLIRQESPFGTSFGNTISVDQSTATNALFGGVGANLTGHLPSLALARLSGQPLALQRGEGNSASVEMTGANGELQLYQSTASLTGGGGNNTATLIAANAALGGIIQIGEANTATLSLDDGQGLISQLGNNNTAMLGVSLNSEGSISQFGNLNKSDLTVRDGGTGTVVQIGNRNDTGPVSVSGGSSLLYTQTGNRLEPVSYNDPTGGLKVITSTNLGTIIINQTAF